MAKTFQIILILLVLVFNFCTSYPYFPRCSGKNFNKQATILSTLNGKIQGECYNIPINYTNGLEKNVSVLTWLSVPYAEAPIGKNRFKKPESKKSWTNILDGTKWPNRCIQTGESYFSYYVDEKINKSVRIEYHNQSEDCLYLNIFVPYDVYSKSVTNKDKSKRAPILVFIHGGSFLIDSSVSDTSEPSARVAISNTIVITINYRLGALGFLYLDKTDAIGNQGFLDQHEAIKWIYKNAEHFGGDNSKITIQGQSAGAFSVGYHLIYKPSWPYFRNAYLESGTPIFTNFVLITPKEATSRALGLSTILGCYDSKNKSITISEVFNCLQSMPVSYYDNAQLYLISQLFKNDLDSFMSSITPFPLVIDGVNFKKSVLKSYAQKEFKPCSILIGYCKDDAGVSIAESGFFGSSFDEIKKNTILNFTGFDYVLKKYFKYYPYYPIISSKNFVNKIISLYVPKNALNNKKTNYLRYLIDIVTDQIFRCPSIQTAELYSSANNNVYVYSYDHKSKISPIPEIYGAGHDDDTPFLFAEPFTIKKQPLISYNQFTSLANNYSTLEKEFSLKLIKYASNFMRYDKPTINQLKDNELPEWHEFNQDNLNFYKGNRNIIRLNANSIENEKYQVDNKYCKFWRDNSYLNPYL